MHQLMLLATGISQETVVKALIRVSSSASTSEPMADLQVAVAEAPAVITLVQIGRYLYVI